jgi:hypothetical protein
MAGTVTDPRDLRMKAEGRGHCCPPLHFHVTFTTYGRGMSAASLIRLTFFA